MYPSFQISAGSPQGGVQGVENIGMVEPDDDEAVGALPRHSGKDGICGEDVHS